MINFHSHTTFSDGELIPVELIRRAKVRGYKAIGISDHADHTNLEFMLEKLLPIKEKYSTHLDIDVVVGVELTHVPPSLIPGSVDLARKRGAEYVIVHGETIVEPVAKGTNLAAIEAGVDILAHPGLISPQEVRLAAQKGTYLELTTRKGHAYTNGYVAKLALEHGAKLLLNDDAHAPSDLLPQELRKKILLGAGLVEDAWNLVCKHAEELLQKILQTR